MIFSTKFYVLLGGVVATGATNFLSKAAVFLPWHVKQAIDMFFVW